MERPPDDESSESTDRDTDHSRSPPADDPPSDGHDSTGPAWPRYLAIGILCLVGLALVVSFTVVMAAGDDLTFTAESFDPETEPADAAAAPEVVDLEQRAENNPDGVETAFETAAAEGIYDEPGSEHPDELTFVASDGDQYEYAVYDGEYYEWESAVGDNSDHVVIELEPTTAQDVMDSVAVSYGDASDEAQSAVDGEEVTGLEISEKVVDDDGTYYAVSMENPGAFIVQLVLASITAVLQAVGVAFLAVGGWLLRKAIGGASRPLTIRSIAAIAAASVVAMMGISALSSSFSVFSLVSLPVISAAVTGFILVGWYARAREYGKLAGVLLGLPIVAIIVAGVAHALIGGMGNAVFGGILTTVAVLGAGLFGWPLIAYGYWFRSSPDPT